MISLKQNLFCTGKKVKFSHYRPEQAPTFLENGHMKVVGCQPYAPAAFIPRIILVLIFRG
jgi:hypothetical protein